MKRPRRSLTLELEYIVIWLQERELLRRGLRQKEIKNKLEESTGVEGFTF